jgi:uncharacterized protein
MHDSEPALPDHIPRGSSKLSYRTPDGILLSAIVTRSSGRTERGNVIFAHGLNNNKDEDGNFVKLSKMLSTLGYNSLRFDFRAHGESEGKSEDMTVSGELLDFETSAKVLEHMVGKPCKFVVVASSMGASASILYASKHADKVEKLVLWNPVLDYDKTFLHAETPWGRTFFNAQGYRDLETQGYVTIPETDFRLGKVVVDEFRTIKPYELLSRFKMPVLTIHGTRDTDVPFSVAKKYGTPNKDSKFISHEAEHTFPGMEDQLLAETVEWITKGR